MRARTTAAVLERERESNRRARTVKEVRVTKPMVGIFSPDFPLAVSQPLPFSHEEQDREESTTGKCNVYVYPSLYNIYICIIYI